MGEYLVYMHTAPNGLRYVGITCQDAERRWRGGMQYSYNKRFFAAIVKFGWDNIKHEILFDSLTKEEAERKEIELIALYKTREEAFGYNLTNGGKGATNCAKSIETIEKLHASHVGKRHSEETKQKISRAQKGRFLGGESPKARKVCQYDKDGNLVKIWDSFMDAARSLDVQYTNIWAVCNHKRKTAKGYKWEYYREGE